MTLFQSSPNDWMKLKRCSNVFAPESGESHMKRVGMLIVSLSGGGGGEFQILVSLMVFWANRHDN